MDNAINSNEAHLRASFLMNRIIKVRYNDMCAEKMLCKQLLEIAQPESDPYAYAFANVYLFDSILALEDYEECMFYLNRASYACHKNRFDDLTVILCNLAGLYYSKMNEVQASIQYYLEGVYIGNKMHDCDNQSKLYNNIGALFAARGDWSYAKNYFSQAYNTIEKSINSENFGFAISFLCNLSEAYQNLGMLEESQKALEKCNAIDTRSSHYHRIRLACAWSSHYGAVKDTAMSVDYQERALEYGLLTYENRYFVSDMCIGLFEVMLNIGEIARARLFMDTLLQIVDEAAVVVKHRFLSLTVRYWQTCGDAKMLNNAYREYYYTARKIAKIDDKAQATSLYAHVQATQAQIERKNMFKSNRELELASQLDELTGLFNRRYFSKLESKIMQSVEVVAFGLIMIDVDCFKQFNDHYGHFKGDAALKAVAEVLKENEVENYYAGRYGGDEFVCMCINFTNDQMENIVKKIVGFVLDKKIPHVKSQASEFLSVSAGYCNEILSDEVTPSKLLKLADKALYQTKAAGKNGYTKMKL